MNHPTFGAELRRLREQRGLSLKKFGKLVNYDPGYLCKVEHGVKPPTDALAKICDAALDTAGQLTRLAAEGAETRKRRLKRPPQATTALMEGGMLPVVADGRLVFVPFDFSVPGIRELGAILNNALQQHSVPTLTVADIITPDLLLTQSSVSLTARDCAQWLAWELWQRNEPALHVTDLPTSIARYLGLIDDNDQLAAHLSLISPDGHILCDKDGYCSFVHASFIDFYVAQRVFTNIANGNNKLLATAQTTHTTDLIVQEFVLRHQPSAGLLTDWMLQGTNAVLRVNSAGILAKLGESRTTDTVISTLKADRDTRQLYLTAVSSRVLTLEWSQAAQFAAKVEHGTGDVGPSLAAAQLALLANELTNPRDGAARWCSAVLLGHFQGSTAELTRLALHHALQTEPCHENLRAIGAVLAGNNPLTT